MANDRRGTAQISVLSVRPYIYPKDPTRRLGFCRDSESIVSITAMRFTLRGATAGYLEGGYMLAVGENELGEYLGETIDCPHCGVQHRIEFGKEKQPDGTWKESQLLSFYKCGDKTYLAGIKGRSITR